MSWGWEVAPDFAERFPLLTRLESEKAFEYDDDTVRYVEQQAAEAFEVGLTVLLDGIEAALTPARVARR